MKTDINQASEVAITTGLSTVAHAPHSLRSLLTIESMLSSLRIHVFTYSLSYSNQSINDQPASSAASECNTPHHVMAASHILIYTTVLFKQHLLYICLENRTLIHRKTRARSPKLDRNRLSLLNWSKRTPTLHRDVYHIQKPFRGTIPRASHCGLSVPAPRLSALSAQT